MVPATERGRTALSAATVRMFRSNTGAEPGAAAVRCRGVSAITSPRRLSAFRALWYALRKAGRPGAPTLSERARVLPRMVGRALAGRYVGLSRPRLVLVALGLVYLISPIDLVPEALLNVFGLGDDAVVALWLVGWFLAETDRFLAWERTPPDVVDGTIV